MTFMRHSVVEYQEVLSSPERHLDSDKTTFIGFDRSQAARIAPWIVVVVVLAIVLAIAFVGPAISLLGLQAVGA